MIIRNVKKIKSLQNDITLTKDKAELVLIDRDIEIAERNQFIFDDEETPGDPSDQRKGMAQTLIGMNENMRAKIEMIVM